MASPMRVRSASWVFAAQVLAKAAGFVVSILLARSLGAEGKGMLSVVQTSMSVLVLASGFGLSSALMYYVPRGEARGRDAMLLAAGLAAAAMAAFVALYAIAGTPIARLLHVTPPALLLIGFVLTGPALVMNLLYSSVVASGSVRSATWIVNGSLLLQLVAYATLFAFGALTLPTALAVWGAGVVGEAVAAALMVRGVNREVQVRHGARPLLARIYRYGLVAWVSNLVGFAALRADTFILSALRGTAAVGVYSVAVTFAELLWFVPMALNAVMLPKVSGEGSDALDVTLRLERVLWPIILAAGVAVTLVAWPVIPLLYGSAFGPAIIPLALLLPGAVAMAMATMPSAYLSGIGKPVLWTRAAAANLLVNVAANFLLIPRYGIAGAALASAISYSIAAVIIIWYFLRETRVSARELLVPTAADFRDFFEAGKRVLRRAE